MSNYEFMYGKSALGIIILLLLFTFLANEIGYRIGKHHKNVIETDVKSQTNMIIGSILGLLGLLLGFTFSLALDKYGARSRAVINEANSLQTALLRTELLKTPYDTQGCRLLYKYINEQIKIGKADIYKKQDLTEISLKTKKITEDLWHLAIANSKDNVSNLSINLFTDAINKAINTEEERVALAREHVPEPILYCLFIVFIVAVGLLGYSSGWSERRSPYPSMIMSILISLIIYIIIDLDRPGRGLIRVDQSSMESLRNGSK